MDAGPADTLKFDAIGRIVVQAAVDFGVYSALAALGVPFLPAQILAFTLASVRPGDFRSPGRPGLLLLLTASLRGLVLVTLTGSFGLSVTVGAVIAAILSANCASVSRSSLWSPPTGPGDESRWKGAAIAVLGASLLLRIAASACLDLLPEEAYYWNYGQHLSLGYLEHPPLIGWIIRLFSELLGHSEFAVRAPALLSWVVAAAFLHRLTGNLTDRASAWRSVMLFSALPVTFGAGLFATPDAPLFACWAAALFFLERALLRERAEAWFGAAVSLGLGLLSRYTIALLLPSTLLFLLLDDRGRRWLARRGPWLALLVTGVLSLPAVFWNATHDGASFALTGTRRWAEGGGFSLHLLLGSFLILLTPVGLYAAAVALGTRNRGFRSAGEARREASRKRRFVLVFTVAPLLVLVAFSIRHAPRLNWSGPMWLALLPLLALQMGGGGRPALQRLRRTWPPTVGVLLTLYATAAFWIAVGAPGPLPLPRMWLPVAWEEMGRETARVAERIAARTGRPPLITGVDRYFLSSELSFYARDAGPTSGRHLFGEDSLMWETWFPASAAVGRDVLLVGPDRRSLDKPSIERRFAGLGTIHELPVRKHGRLVIRVYWRLGTGYLDSPALRADRGGR